MPNAIIHLSSIQKERALSQLKGAALFEGLDANMLDSIVNRMSLIVLRDADVLFGQQTSAVHLYLLSTGQIKLSRSASNGSEKIISLITPPNTFAEAVMFSATRVYPVSAVAIGDCSVWAIDSKHFMSVLKQSNEACFAVIKRLTERLHHQVAEIERLTLHTAGSRLIAYLLAEVPVDWQENSAVVTLGVPKNVIASRLSIVPATFSRALGKLSREGLLDVREHEVELLDIQQLRRFVEEVLV